ncbi:contact-dependent growth inhibition system immunity protein [Kalamiella sp. sgz302252]|uniref:contact-dependent growth inhibition system immunity protein n=1 Tax=Pantoea sp. sgz302252 TaxID=3341827 RepID=UPI0036D2AFCA
MKFNKGQDYWAVCYCTNEFLLIETQSGLGRTGSDPLFPSHLLSPDADDQCIGKTILQALSDSRTLDNLEDRIAFFDLEKGKEKYANWIAMLMDEYSYKTKRALFKDMKHCIIHYVNDAITISPMRHEKLEAWEGLEQSENVILSLDNTPSEIGAGLRLALSRCKG